MKQQDDSVSIGKLSGKSGRVNADSIEVVKIIANYSIFAVSS
jgi:hypothetical protein